MDNSLCFALHQIMWSAFRFSYPYDWPPNTKDGIYVMFEKGETGHQGDRIVRIGTHTGDGQLESRLKQHFSLKNKDRSIFRKNIGRCYLNAANDPYLKIWDIDNTAKNSSQYLKLFDRCKENEIESNISNYLQTCITFAIIRVFTKEERLRLESRIISTVSKCTECHPTSGWLGLNSPKEKIRSSGLWQVNELYKTPLTCDDLDVIYANIVK